MQLKHDAAIVVFLGFTRHTRHTKISCAKSDTDPIPRYDHYFEYFGVLALFFHLLRDDTRAKRATLLMRALLLHFALFWGNSW